MKIAVCVSGTVTCARSNGIKRYNNILRSKFPNADFYFATWKSNEGRFYRELPNMKCLALDEPIMHYHPYLDMNPQYYASSYFNETLNWIKAGGKERAEWSSHHTKQILIHSALVNSLPEEYDIIVRTRYDAFIYDNANFEPYITDSYENKRANCFAVTRKEKFADMYQSDVISNPKMKHWLLDQLIIHPRELINTSEVVSLHKDKKLNPAEHGWYQILSKPYGSNHINNHGWVNHDKNVLTEFLDR